MTDEKNSKFFHQLCEEEHPTIDTDNTLDTDSTFGDNVFDLFPRSTKKYTLKTNIEPPMPAPSPLGDFIYLPSHASTRPSWNALNEDLLEAGLTSEDKDVVQLAMDLLDHGYESITSDGCLVRNIHGQVILKRRESDGFSEVATIEEDLIKRLRQVQKRAQNDTKMDYYGQGITTTTTIRNFRKNVLWDG